MFIIIVLQFFKDIIHQISALQLSIPYSSMANSVIPNSNKNAASTSKPIQTENISKFLFTMAVNFESLTFSECGAKYLTQIIQCSQERYQRKWRYNHPHLTIDQTRDRGSRKPFTRFHSFVRLSNIPLCICTALSFVETRLDLETVTESEVSQKVKTNTVYETNIAYMWNIEKWYR